MSQRTLALIVLFVAAVVAAPAAVVAHAQTVPVVLTRNPPARMALRLRLEQPGHTPQPDRWAGADKVKHFFISAFIESVTFGGLLAVGASHNAALAGAIGTGAAFGIGREIHDKRTKGQFSVKDLTWDAAGVGAAAVMLRSTQR